MHLRESLAYQLVVIHEYVGVQLVVPHRLRAISYFVYALTNYVLEPVKEFEDILLVVSSDAVQLFQLGLMQFFLS